MLRANRHFKSSRPESQAIPHCPPPPTPRFIERIPFELKVRNRAQHPSGKNRKRGGKSKQLQEPRTIEIRGFAGEPENQLENASIFGEKRARNYEAQMENSQSSRDSPYIHSPAGLTASAALYTPHSLASSALWSWPPHGYQSGWRLNATPCLSSCPSVSSPLARLLSLSLSTSVAPRNDIPAGGGVYVSAVVETGVCVCVNRAAVADAHLESHASVILTHSTTPILTRTRDMKLPPHPGVRSQ